MSLSAHISTTRSSAACVELRDGEQIVLKAYASPDERKIRIVLPELCNFKQTLIDVEAHWLEFARAADGGMPNAHRAPIAAAKVKCSVLGCERLASFIIRKTAYCEQHRGVAK